MKIDLLVFLSFINITFSIIPLWNIKESSCDLCLKKSSTVTVFDETKNKTNVVLTKAFIKEENEILQKNYININGQSIETEWEDIQSFFFTKDSEIYICPKGKNFLNFYDGSQFHEIIPQSFNYYKDNWELICYYQPDKNIIFYGFLYLSSQYNLYGQKLPYESFYSNYRQQIGNTLFDFIWTTNPGIDNKYKMIAATGDYEIFLKQLLIMIEEDTYYYNIRTTKFVDYKSKHFYFHFAKYFDKIGFYWITANSTSEFGSGYSIGPLNAESSFPFMRIGIHENSTSPFNYLYPNKTIIKNLNMIRNTRFIYYEIEYNKIEEKKEIYYGIIDVELNQIIFNTNEKIKEFKPLKNYSMLAITESTAYEICAIKENNKCVERCSSGKLILDAEKGNYCSDSQKCENYLLIPHNVCIKNCDESIFVLNEQRECGLCKDIFGMEKPYKIINAKGCLDHMPKYSYYHKFNPKSLFIFGI